MLNGLARIVIVIGSFLIAMCAALALGVRLGLERFTQANVGSEDRWWALAELMWQGVQLSFGVTLVIAILVVVVGEVARIRSALFYIAGGGLAVAAAPLFIEFQRAGTIVSPPMMIWQVFATAGFVGGGIYWFLAGRRA
jgi:hypothetical protein